MNARTGRLVNRFIFSLALGLAGFAAGIAVTDRLPTAADALAVGAPDEPAPPAPTPSPAPVQGTPAPPAAAPAIGPDFTRVASRAVRGVVNISATQVTRRSNSPFLDDPFFRYFFGDQDMFGSRDRRSLSLGSGVVISPDGYVVTNSHVIGEDISRIHEVTIALADKREIGGLVVGSDPTTDIAVLKIDVTGLPALSWGDSSRLKVGE